MVKKGQRKCYYCGRFFSLRNMGVYKGERICVRCERKKR